MLRLWGPTLTAGVALCTASADAQPLRRRGSASITVDAVAFFPSQYSDTLELFDHGPLSAGLQTAARVTRRLTPWIELGGRVGWLWTTSSHDPNDAVGLSPVERLSFNVVDLSAVLRLIATPRGATAGGVRAHFDLELGPAFGFAALRGQTETFVSARVGARAFVGYQFRESPLYVGLSAGGQYLPWGGAGAGGGDPVFAGFSTGIELGVAL